MRCVSWSWDSEGKGSKVKYLIFLTLSHHTIESMLRGWIDWLRFWEPILSYHVEWNYIYITRSKVNEIVNCIIVLASNYLLLFNLNLIQDKKMYTSTIRSLSLFLVGNESENDTTRALSLVRYGTVQVTIQNKTLRV